MHWLCSRLDKIAFIDFNLTFNYSPSYHLRLFLIILKIEPVVREGFKKKSVEFSAQVRKKIKITWSKNHF